jgi:intracellular multiplication protein IcmO
MKSGRFSTIEGVNEVPLREVIVDVRSQSQKFFAWLTYPQNYAKVMIGLALLLFIAPILLPVLLFVILVFADNYARVSQYLPMRYAAWTKEKDPGLLHPGSDMPLPAEGIMYFGIVDAKDPYERNKQVFASADDLTRHMLVLGTTGSGKSEFLKGMTFNVLCWASGFFVADAKADNKLPTDLYSQVRMFARDYDFLVLNYLLGGLSPTQITSMRERLSNGVQPATAADADTLVQMTSNIMVKASGDSKTWQDRGLNLFRGIARALVYKRETGQLTLSLETLREYLNLDKIEELYIEGWKLAGDGIGAWPMPYIGVKSYLEVGLPGFKVDVMMRKHGLLKEEGEGEDPMSMQAAFARTGPKKPQPTTQSNETFNQHGYRSDQVYPALSLLIDTYGHIFKRKHPEIDMQDVVVNNRICVSLIPSLEKGSQEQESLGKLNLALLRVMMARALGMSVEGDVKVNVDAKITASATPFALFLDEFAYQFAEGIALTAAQARSLNFFLCALAQDLEKLTEGDRASEAGAMMANQATKFFMKIIGSDKTHELAAKTIGEAEVAVMASYERQTDVMGSVHRERNYKLEKRPRISREVLENLPSGFATFAYRQRAHVMRTFYPSPEVPRVRFPRINRFLQLPDIERITMTTCAVDMEPTEDKWAIDQVKKLLKHNAAPEYAQVITSDVIQSIVAAAHDMNQATPALERGIVLYQAGIEALLHAKKGAHILSRSSAGGSMGVKNSPQNLPSAAGQGGASGSPNATTQPPQGPPPVSGALQEADLDDRSMEDIFDNFDPLAEALRINPPITRKKKDEVFGEEMAALASNEPEVTIEAASTEVAPEQAEHEVGATESAGPALNANDLNDDIEQDVIFSDGDLDIGQVLLGDAASEATPPAPLPVAIDVQIFDHEQVQADLQALKKTLVDADIVERMGSDVVGLRDPTLTGLAQIEKSLGATDEEAVQAAVNTEKVVAQSLSLLDNDKANTSGTDVEMLFNEIENLIGKNT